MCSLENRLSNLINSHLQKGRRKCVHKLYAVIGDPIAHSMSPVMHNDLFSLYKLDGKYERKQIKHINLEAGIKELRTNQFAGFNVTIPHKTTIIPLLDEIDPLAKAIGAVNTVVNDNGKLIGYNTDGVGFIRGLQEVVFHLKGKKVLIIGAGGAARAIYFSLASEDIAEIDIANRTVEKAASLISTCPYEVNSKAYSIEEGEKLANDYEVIIQTTSIGMSPHTNCSPFSVANVQSGTVVCDIIYNPLETMFLTKAKQQGALTLNGLPMFVYQGALAFEKWTGIFPDTERMKNTILAQL